MIYNSTLKNLESAATYVNEIKQKVKGLNYEKHLLFRIADYQESDDIKAKLLG